MKFRAAQNADRPAIWRILEPIFRAGDTYAIDRDISRDDALAYWCDPPAITTVALSEDGAAIGTYYLRRNQGGGGAHVCNCGFATAPAARGRGIARAMLNHALDAARAAGYAAMQFNFVVSTNTRAIAIWQNAGFDTVGRLPAAFDHPDLGRVDALVMMKSL
ncbi:MAG: GNAT family N-acetyltransferase [Rhodobacteraceae bacterium]|nr:GNAT family N-acetyltransferase [Paracoccaceae bacterium]